MIGELKDLWLVFRKTYDEHFALKLKAADSIKEYKSKMDSVGRVCYLIDETCRNLDELYFQLPIKERKDFVKSTLNLLKYGIKINEDESFSGHGFDKIYSNLHHRFESVYKEIKKLYKEKRYDDVIERVDDMLTYLDIFYSKYKITEQK